MSVDLNQDAIYRPRKGLMVQHNMIFADYSNVHNALEDPSFEFPSPEDVAIMVSNRGLLFELNLLGAFVWEMIDGIHTIADIENSVTAMFDIDKQAAHEDLIELVGSMIEFGLIDQVTS